MVKVYGYSRSNTTQEKLEKQNEEIKSYALENGYEVEIFSDIVSGTQVGTQLQDLMEVISIGDKLIMVDPTRLTRNLIEGQKLINDLAMKNVDLILLDELN